MKTLLVAERSLMAEAAIAALCAQGHEVAEIWTLCAPDRMLGRSYARFLTPRPRCTGTQIHKHNIEVRQIKSAQRKNLNALLDEMEPVEMLVCAGSHLIFPERFLDRFPGRAFNLHPALLPGYRGPQPRLAMLFDGALDQFGGVTLHCLSPGIDEGDIIAQRRIPRSSYRNFMAWDMANADACHDLLSNEMNAFLRGELAAAPQDPALASYQSLKAKDALITGQWPFEKLADFLNQFYGFMGRSMVLVPGAGEMQTAISVCGSPTRLGNPAGLAPAISSTAVEMDILDARVALKRVTRSVRLADSLERYRTIIIGK